MYTYPSWLFTLFCVMCLSALTVSWYALLPAAGFRTVCVLTVAVLCNSVTMNNSKSAHLKMALQAEIYSGICKNRNNKNCYKLRRR
jgi:hypothetical protein